MSLAQTIAAIRNKKGLTQEDLAGMTNLTVRTIQRIESGETIPRAFTLKSIAAALDTSFEALQSAANANSDRYANADALYQREDSINFLQLLCLSCFSYLIIPFVHFLIPMYVLKKRKEQDPVVLSYARRVIRNQIYWIAALVLLFLLAVAYNTLSSVYFNKNYLVSYLVPFFVMYFINALIIIIATVRVKRIQFNNSVIIN